MKSFIQHLNLREQQILTEGPVSLARTWAQTRIGGTPEGAFTQLGSFEAGPLGIVRMATPVYVDTPATPIMTSPSYPAFFDPTRYGQEFKQPFLDVAGTETTRNPQYNTPWRSGNIVTQISPTGMTPEEQVTFAHEGRHARDYAATQFNIVRQQLEKIGDPAYKEAMGLFQTDPSELNRQAVIDIIQNKAKDVVPSSTQPKSKHFERLRSRFPAEHVQEIITPEESHKIGWQGRTDIANYVTRTTEREATKQSDITRIVQRVENQLRKLEKDFPAAVSSIDTALRKANKMQDFTLQRAEFLKTNNPMHLQNMAQITRNAMVDNAISQSHSSFTEPLNTFLQKVPEIKQKILSHWGVDKPTDDPNNFGIFPREQREKIAKNQIEELDLFIQKNNADVQKGIRDINAASHLILTHGLGFEGQILKALKRTMPQDFHETIDKQVQSFEDARDPTFEKLQTPSVGRLRIKPRTPSVSAEPELKPKPEVTPAIRSRLNTRVSSKAAAPAALAAITTGELLGSALEKVTGPITQKIADWLVPPGVKPHGGQN